MILPSKHISTQQTLLGVGAVIINELDKSQTVTSLWERVRTANGVGNFERFVLTLDMLYIIGAIELSDGLIERIHA